MGMIAINSSFSKAYDLNPLKKLLKKHYGGSSANLIQDLRSIEKNLTNKDQKRSIKRIADSISEIEEISLVIRYPLVDQKQ